MQASVLLLHWGSYCWARNLFVLIIFFFLPVMLPFVLPRLASDSAASVSWCLETSLFMTPFLGRSSVHTSFVSFFVFYMFLSYLFLKTMISFSGCLMSSASIQKLFCGICSVLKCSFDEFEGESGLRVLFLCHLRTAPLNLI